MSYLDRYVGAHQAQVDAARRAAAVHLAKLRGADAEARAARGLVSVSTSGFDGSRGEAGSSVRLPFASRPTVIEWAERCITIDRAQARVTRLRKGVGVGAKALLNLAPSPMTNNVMVTLTYRGTNADWRPRHVSDYIRKVREWFKERCPDQRLKYLWVAELQQRGVIHYHAVFFLPEGVSMPKADKRGWWPHGMTNTLKATAPVAYVMKYASKVDSKNVGGFPRGARIFGLGGLCSVGAAIKRWVLWPAYVQGNAAAGDGFRPAVGGGFRNDETGEFLQSEYVPTGGGFSSFIRVREAQRATLVDGQKSPPVGPFSWLSSSPLLH